MVIKQNSDTAGGREGEDVKQEAADRGRCGDTLGFKGRTGIGLGVCRGSRMRAAEPDAGEQHRYSRLPGADKS